MSNESNSRKTLPGLSLELFTKAVAAVIESRDSGELLVFLAKNSGLRFIGPLDGFRNDLEKRVEEEEISLDRAAAILREVQEVFEVSLMVAHKHKVEFAIDYLFDRSEDQTAEDRNALRELVKKKLALVEERLELPPIFRQLAG